MRLCEISTLKVNDLHDTYIKVFGKGRKEREIGVHPTVSKLLWKYIHKFRSPLDETEQALFLGSGRSSGRPLGYGGVKQVLEKVKRISGVSDVRLSAHTFRHTFAKMYLNEGGEIFKLSREMGHSSSQVTKIYLEDYNSSEARKEHNSFSPINRLKINKQAKRTDPDRHYWKNKENEI
jgi:integrase/recombinase XerD